MDWRLSELLITIMRARAGRIRGEGGGGGGVEIFLRAENACRALVLLHCKNKVL